MQGKIQQGSDLRWLDLDNKKVQLRSDYRNQPGLPTVIPSCLRLKSLRLNMPLVFGPKQDIFFLFELSSVVFREAPNLLVPPLENKSVSLPPDQPNQSDIAGP